jgi:hypothetical protein
MFLPSIVDYVTYNPGGCWYPLGGWIPPHGVSRNMALKKRIYIGITLYLGIFSTHGFFADGFLFLVKELWFWTNPGHWVRVLDDVGSYMYFLL